MTQFGGLDRNPSGEIKDVLFSVEVQPPSSPAELLIEERIVVGLPVDLSDVEVAGDAEVPTEAAQMFPLQRLALDAGTDFGQGV